MGQCLGMTLELGAMRDRIGVPTARESCRYRQESDEQREAPSPEQLAAGRHDPGPAVLHLTGVRWRPRRSRIGGA